MSVFRVLFVVALLTAAGCTRELAGPDDPDAPGLSSRSLDVTVTYRVEGTYAACDVRYLTDYDQERTARNVELPWSATVDVRVFERKGAFPATVRATCADETKLGKSAALVALGEAVKAQGGAVGYGATAEATYWISAE